jgi:hypothetical protein
VASLSTRMVAPASPLASVPPQFDLAALSEAEYRYRKGRTRRVGVPLFIAVTVLILAAAFEAGGFRASTIWIALVPIGAIWLGVAAAEVLPPKDFVRLTRLSIGADRTWYTDARDREILFPFDQPNQMFLVMEPATEGLENSVPTKANVAPRYHVYGAGVMAALPPEAIRALKLEFQRRGPSPRPLRKSPQKPSRWRGRTVVTIYETSGAVRPMQSTALS